MKNILIINGATPYMHAKGELGSNLCDVAENTLISLDFDVSRTNIARGYNIDEEIQKLLKADIWIWQIPGWWMSEPWTVKKYIDEVFTNSHGAIQADNKNKNKKYMFSYTWNLPKSAFAPGGFFNGKNVDEVLFHLHKIFNFLEMEPLPTFMCNDVIKTPNVQQFYDDYKEHIINIFKDNPEL